MIAPRAGARDPDDPQAAEERPTPGCRHRADQGCAGRARERGGGGAEGLVRGAPREREVLQALAEGLSDKEIAERLHLSVRTARTHMLNILAKLGVESRLQALVLALRHGAATLR